MSSYSSLDIAISICRYTALYELYNYKNYCDRIELQIEKTLEPYRKKVLRSSYLMNSINKVIDSQSDICLESIDNNSDTIEYIQNIQEDIIDKVTSLREIIEESYKTYIDINNETDAQLLARFRDEPKIHDLIHIRNVLNQSRDSISVPISLTSKEMDEMSYNNRRIDANMLSVRRNGENLGNALSLSSKQRFIKEVIYKSIKIQTMFENEGLKDYIKNHTNEEVKRWLYGRIT